MSKPLRFEFAGWQVARRGDYRVTFRALEDDHVAEAAPGHAMLVRKLFFEPLPDNLVAPLTAAMEHIQVSLNLDSSLPPAPR